MIIKIKIKNKNFKINLKNLNFEILIFNFDVKKKILKSYKKS